MLKLCRKYFFCFGIFFALLFFSCSKSSWKNSLEQAKNLSQKKGKPILGFVWNDDSDSKIKENVLSDKNFSSEMENDFVLSLIPVDEATKTLGIQKTPMFVLLSAEGFLLQTIDFPNAEIFEAEKIKDNIQNGETERQKISSLIEKFKNSNRIEKIKNFDSLFSATPRQNRKPLMFFLSEIPYLDEKNESHLVGTYALEKAFFDSGEALEAGDVEKAIDIFCDTASLAVLSDGERLECFYTASLILAASGSTDYERMLLLLQKAEESAPASPENFFVQDSLSLVERMKKTYSGFLNEN